MPHRIVSTVITFMKPKLFNFLSIWISQPDLLSLHLNNIFAAFCDFFIVERSNSNCNFDAICHDLYKFLLSLQFIRQNKGEGYIQQALTWSQTKSQREKYSKNQILQEYPKDSPLIKEQTEKQERVFVTKNLQLNSGCCIQFSVAMGLQSLNSAQQYNFGLMSKIRKVYNLRKTANVKSSIPPEQSRLSQLRQEPQTLIKAQDNIDKNLSSVSVNMKQTNNKIQQQVHQQALVEVEELMINKLQLNFSVPINDIDKKDVKIKNIGNSAVYVQFQIKNLPKINNSGFKDPKLKFHCHHQNTVIKPGEQITFVFSFISDFPGNFTQEVKIICQPPVRTSIPNLKLNGRAFILDEWQANLKKFSSSLSEEILKDQVSQILNDVVNSVKLPPPPRPDVTNIKIAQRQFQKRNKQLNLYFNEYLHNWFNELFVQICDKKNILVEERYWDQSVQTLRNLIEHSPELDEVDQKCYKDRLQHYCYLSLTPSPNKSQLYQTIYQFLSSTAYNIGGEYVDAARKELDMWEVPFREPLLTDTPEDLKARKEEVDKIKSQWVKKAKKKKWGQQEQKQMLNQFKKKVQVRANEWLLNKFTNFEESAQFIKTRQFFKKSDFTLSEYKNELERIKTVKQYALDGKKVLLKWNLKLKDKVQHKLKELEEYLNKKKEEEKRLQQQKKQGAKKKKAPPKPKKKGLKQEEQLKPLHFDFMSILDEQNWNGFLQTFKTIMEKQPFLVLIGITYGPRCGRYIQEYSIHFLLEHLKTIQTSIEFLSHDQLPSLNQRIQNQSIGQGSILLMQNLNFLPWEVTQQQVVQQAVQEGKSPSITKRKLLHPQIREFFDNLGLSIDVLVNQDRFLEQISGFSAYLNKQVIMGTQWWRYTGLSTRVIDSTIIFTDQFNPENSLLLYRLITSAKQVYLTGQIGVKFYLVQNNVNQLGHIKLSHVQSEQITNFLNYLKHHNLSHKLKITADFTFTKSSQANVEFLNYDNTQTNVEGFNLIDIGEKTIENINKIDKGHLFILGDPSIHKDAQKPSESLSKILKSIFKKQQEKRQRHLNQSSSLQGINYNQDLVVYLVGLSQNLVEKIQLKDKKVKISEEQAQQQAQEEEGENEKKKIDLICDFRLSSLSCLYRLWRGKFDLALKDISKYPIIRDD